MDTSINWLESARRSLERVLPDCAGCAETLACRLSHLWLERLPHDLAHEILALLPEGAGLELRNPRLEGADASIGYLEFVARTRQSLGMTEVLATAPYAESEEAYERLCEETAHAFLWAVAEGLHPDLKHRVSEHVSQDLRCRMNLYCAHTPQDKVA